jgi:putative endopeptidase
MPYPTLRSVSILLVGFASNAFCPPSLKIPEILDGSALKDGRNGGAPVDPCQDFYQFSCGHWIETTEIPADKDRVMHQSTALIDRTDEQLNQLILRLQKGDAALQTEATQPILDYYRSCLTFDKSVPAAQALLKTTLAQVDRISDLTQLTPILATLHRSGTGAFFLFGSGPDLKDSNSVIGFLEQGGMGLPEPSYYLEKEPKSKEIRQKYISHITKILTLVGQGKKMASRNARTVLALETRLAEKAMSFDERQDPSKTNHPLTREALKQLAPAIDWEVYFNTLAVPQSGLNINEPEFFHNLSEVIQSAPLADLRAYLTWQIASRSASEVSPELDRENFEFWDKYLHGQNQMKPRWKRCTQEVEHDLGYALAEIYVKTVDTEAIRDKVRAMIRWIQQTFEKDLETLSTGEHAWLDRSTKAEALKKLSKLREKLGAPEKWRDYSALVTEPSNFLLNDIRIVEFENRRDIAKIGKPLDRLEWDMMPWEINAYYDPPKNEFVFPFGILQPPSLDVKASDGANLGAFGGGTIGHELTHGFDNDGRQYDANGNVKDWWTKETKQKFEERTQCFVQQANQYKIESVGLSVDGKKTLPENLADQGGVKLAYEALRIAMEKRPPAPLWLGKYTEKQQYWIAYAQSWCGKAKPETLRQQIKTNSHPPEEFRVNGVIMNRPEFARDFSCKEGSRMAPQVRCSLW